MVKMVGAPFTVALQTIGIVYLKFADLESGQP